MGMFPSNLISLIPIKERRISVSIVELESGATMTEELRVIIFIALGLSGVIGVWLSALWVAGGGVLP